MMTLALMVISILRQKQFKFYIFIVGKRSRNYHTVMFWKVHKWLAHFLLLKVHSCTKKHLIDCRNVFSTTEVLLLLLYLNFGKMILHSAHFICFYLRWRTLTVSSFLISATDVICCSKFAVRISGNSVKDAFSVCFPTSEALWWEHCYHLLLNKSGTGWDNPVIYSDLMLSFTRRAYACRAYGLWQPCMSFACRAYGFFLLLKDLWNRAVE